VIEDTPLSHKIRFINLTLFIFSILVYGLFATYADNRDTETFEQGESTPEVTSEPTNPPPLDVQIGPAFVVNTTSEFANDGYCSDSHCTLGEAVIATNNYAGLATIVLSPVTYLFTETQYAYTALPLITGNVIIEGNNATIERNNNASTPSFRLLANQGTLVLSDLTLRNGDNSFAYGTFGGTLFQSTGDLTLNNVTVADSYSTSGGAGLYIESGTATINNSRFLNNESHVSYGGAIFSGAGTLSVNNSEFINNSASSGGAIYGETSVVTVSNSSILYNSATYGGGIYGNYHLTVINSTIAYNYAATSGGAIHTGTTYNSSELTVINSTFVGNGWRALRSLTGADNTTIQHSIFARHAQTCYENSLWSPESQYNIIEDASCAASTPDSTTLENISVNVGGIGYYGGETAIVPLLPGSPAIDLIPSANCLQSVDQHGNPRPVNNACDAGAYETTLTAASADLRVSQNVVPTEVTFDDHITYTITVTNDGSSTANFVSIASPIGDGQVFVSANPHVGTYNLMTGIWEIGTLNAGASVILELTTRLDDNGDLLLSHYSELVMSSAVDPDSTPNNGIVSEDDWDDTNISILCTPRTITVPANDADALIEAFEKVDQTPCTVPRTIVLAENAVYSLDTVYEDLDGIRTMGLPAVSRTITVEGNSATIERSTNAPSFRLLYVTNTGQLTLNHVVLRGGLANRGTNPRREGSYGGAIYNAGILTVQDSLLIQNEARHTSRCKAAMVGTITNNRLIWIECRIEC
jgi:uncharacterized repeat protein (TIGR01451 family)